MILFFGDIHGEEKGAFNYVESVVKSQIQKPNAIIFLGDLGAQKPLEQELASVINSTDIYFIHGNHDSEDQNCYDSLFKSSLAHKNLHGVVVEIDGLKVAGLGGVFRKEIWHPQINGGKECFQNYQEYYASLLEQEQMNQYKKTGKYEDVKTLTDPVLLNKALTHTTSIFPEVYWKLADMKCDVLVTHEAPSCHPYGFTEIDFLAQSIGANHTFHGHHHDRLDYSAQSKALGFIANGVGFRGVSDLQGKVIKTGDYDKERKLRIHIDGLTLKIAA